MASTVCDPEITNWAALQLPDTWPDKLRLSKPVDLYRLLNYIFSSQSKSIELPSSLPGIENIPKYILQEFHNLPNGNYSKTLTRGYLTSFDRVMLGELSRARKVVADNVKGLQSILDIGCAGGQMAGVLAAQGAKDVWGIDPSVYLLQHASQDFPSVRFVQGIAEHIPFPDQRFDSVTVCFVFHEMPPKFIKKSLIEIHRVLRSGGTVVICEPSIEQAVNSRWCMLKQFGLKGLYFSFLAKMIHEPFLHAWHGCNVDDLLTSSGFQMLSDESKMPVRYITARKSI